jgi:hypothetical protein
MQAWGQRAELEKIIQRKVLSNGLEVIVVENHGVPLATIEIDVKNGSFTQSPEYEGLAHMYEHMFFRANTKYTEPNEFWDRASDLGAVFNGSRSSEMGFSFWRRRSGVLCFDATSWNASVRLSLESMTGTNRAHSSRCSAKSI